MSSVTEPASRKGDDVIIWNLLANDEGSDSPEELWRNRARKYAGEPVHTGFLMSKCTWVAKRKV